MRNKLSKVVEDKVCDLM